MSLIGQRIRHLRIEERLGQGGMGEVYLARDLVLDRLVAVKMLRAEHRLSAEGKVRFLREARLLSKLGDAAICQIYELVETPEADYLVLEYVRGRTLREAAANLSLEEKLALMAKVARALAVAHRAGIVHRDLKSDNLMVTPEGEIKILDFGVARSVDAEALEKSAGADGQDASAVPPASPLAELDPTEHFGQLPATLDAQGDPETDVTSVLAWPEDRQPSSSTGITQEGSVVGTLGAMSPEQAAGEPINEASDLYSFGILLQELLTGQSAYGDARGLVLWQRVMRAETEPCSGFDPELLALLRELLSVDSQKRPGAELVAVRLGWIGEKPERERRLRRRRRWIGAAFLGLTLISAFTLYLAWTARQAREKAELRREVAEGLIAFMLGNLSDKLQEVGRLDVLDTVGDRALSYFEALPESEISAEELGWRLQGMAQMVEVYRAKGDFVRAAEVLERAKAMARPFEKGFVGEFRIAAATLRLATIEGQTAYDLGDVEAAAERWRDCVRRAEALQARWPGQARMEVATARHNLGTSLLDQKGHSEEGIELLRQALVAEEEQIARGHAGSMVIGLRAATRAFLSRALEKQGDLAGALEVRRHYLAELEEAAEADPENAAHRFDLAVARGFVAGLEAVCGEFAAAGELFDRGAAEMAKLAAADPLNAELPIWLARFQISSAEVRNALGNQALALEGLDQAQAIGDAWLAGNPDMPASLDLLGLVHLRRGLVLEGSDPAGAWVEARKAVHLLGKLLPNADAGQRANFAAAELLQARVGRQANEREAEQAWRAAEEALAPLERPLLSTQELEVELELELHLGRQAAAEALFARLDAMGWKSPSRERLATLMQTEGRP